MNRITETLQLLSLLLLFLLQQVLDSNVPCLFFYLSNASPSSPTSASPLRASEASSQLCYPLPRASPIALSAGSGAATCAEAFSESP